MNAYGNNAKHVYNTDNDATEKKKNGKKSRIEYFRLGLILRLVSSCFEVTLLEIVLNAIT